MFLNDIGKIPSTAFKKINRFLENNYGFKITEDVNLGDLSRIMEHIRDEITDLKIKGDSSVSSPEISKRLLVLEGMKNLQESVEMQFQSPKLEYVIRCLTDYVVDAVELTAMHGQPEFDRALENAMDEYRSSRYRFPDDIIEQRVRQAATDEIMNQQDIVYTLDETFGDLEMRDIKEDDPFGEVGKRASATGGYAASTPNTPQARHAMKVLDNPKLSLIDEPKDDEMVPMIRDKHGRMVPDPFAASSAARRKGIVMKEHTNLVKNLRFLLETEVSQAQVMMAAKGFAQELQEMVEKIGRLQNEDLPPVTDQMRETYGTESASAFQTQIYGALQNVMDSLYTAKGQVDDAVQNMALTGQYTASTDMDKAVDFDEPEEIAPMGDLDNIEDELEAEDDFGGAEESEPLGRSKKLESTNMLHHKVLEMKKLVDKARKLKEERK